MLFYWEKNTPESKLNHNYGGVLQLMAAVMWKRFVLNKLSESHNYKLDKETEKHQHTILVLFCIRREGEIKVVLKEEHIIGNKFKELS